MSLPTALPHTNLFPPSTVSFLLEKIFANFILSYLSSGDLLVARQVCKSWHAYVDQLSPRCQHLLFLKPMTEPTDMRHFEVLNAGDFVISPAEPASLHHFDSTALIEGDGGWLHRVERVINPFLRCVTTITALRSASPTAMDPAAPMVPMTKTQKASNLHAFSDDTRYAVVTTGKTLKGAHPQALWKMMYFSQPPLKRVDVF